MSKKEIQEQIDWLTSNKQNIRSHSGFGDDHHAAIEAQIDVLENDLDEDEIETKYGSDSDNYADNILTNANEARYWRDGNTEDNPSNNWRSLLIVPEVTVNTPEPKPASKSTKTKKVALKRNKRQ